MKRLIAPIATLGLLAAPALAAGTPVAKPTSASLQQQHKKGKLAGAKITKTSMKPSKDVPKSN